MPPPLAQLALAGAPVLRIGTGGAPQALAPLDAALLAWLALEGPTPRARIAALLWPEKDGDAARNLLRQRLFRHRKMWGVELVVGSATLALAEGVTHDLDDADDVLGQGEVPAEGDYARWLAMQRGRRQSRVRQALVDLCEMAERARDFDDALQHAQELLVLEPLSEEAHRRVMRLHYLRGDRSAALLAFDACERLLKDEVGARPSAETMALLATIDAASSAAAGLPSRAMPAALQRPPRFVGRARELSALEAAWQAGHVSAVVGEAGVGKSRLLHEFGAARAGVVAVSGRPGDAGVPFATLARLLRALVQRAPSASALQDLPDPSRRELARVLPEFEAAAGRPTGEGQRLVLLRAVQALIDAAPEAATLMVDDLHFADAASLDLLAGLVDREADESAARPHSWVLAWRPAEAGSPLHALQDRLTEQVRLVSIVLEPLEESALAELIDALGLPGIRGAALAPALRRRTGGNPLFVLETLKQAWAEQALGELAEARGLPRPQSVGRLIERRVAQLSPGALALARVASIAGVDFSIELAESVLQAGAMQFADAINELEAAQVMRGNQFAHDLVFDAVRDSVPQAIAQLTHARVAAWLEPRHAEPARVARHWIEAGRPRQAVPWLDRAAEAAQRALRPREFIAFRDKQSRIEETEGRHAEAFAAGLQAVRAFIDIDNGTEALEQRVARLEQLAGSAADRCEVALVRANAVQLRGEPEAGVRAAEAALALARQADDQPLLARARSLLGASLLTADRLEDAVRHLEAALIWADAHADDFQRALGHGELAAALDNLGRPEEALLHHQTGLELCVRSRRYVDAATVCANLACNRIDAGDLAVADDWLQRGQQWVEAHNGERSQQALSQMLRTLTLATLGRYRDALRMADLALQSASHSQPGYLAHAQLREAQVWWHLGQWTRVKQRLQATPVDQGSALSLRAMHALLGWHCAQCGPGGDASTRNARAALQELAREIAGVRRPDLSLPLRIECATFLPADEALRELCSIRDIAERIGHRGTALACHIRAAAFGLGLDAAEAAAEARQALAMHDSNVRTTALLPGELWLHSGRALRGASDPLAASVIRRGTQWLHGTADGQVPEAFRDSFLHRNPVNRELLALAAQQAAD